MNDPTDNHEAMQMCMDCGCPKSDHDPDDAAFPMRCNACSCPKFNSGITIASPAAFAGLPVEPADNVLPPVMASDAELRASLETAEKIAPVVELKSADPLRKFTAAAEAKHGFAPGGLVDAMNRDRTKRGEILAHAAALVDGPRNDDYGDPVDNHERIAALWAVILGHVVSAEQVAMCLIQLKMSRLMQNPRHADSWVDICGYASIGGEIARVHETGQNF